MNHPCNLRPSNGKQCAIDFGRKYATEHGKQPTYQEVTEHLRLSEYSNQWANVLRSWVYATALKVLVTSEHPTALKNKIAMLEVLRERYFFMLDKHGVSDYEVSVEMRATHSQLKVG